MSDTNRKASLLAAVSLLATLLLGVAIGYAMNRRAPRRPGVLVSMSANPATLFLDRATLLDSLGLDPARRAEIDSVLGANQARIESLMDTLRTNVRVVTDETRNAVRSRLDERQRARFDSLLAAARPVRMRSPLPPARNP